MNTGSNFIDGYVSIRPSIFLTILFSTLLIFCGIYFIIKNIKKKNTLFLTGIFMVVLFSSMLYFYSIEIPKHIRYVTITFVKNDTEIKVLRDWEFKSRSYLSSDYQIILDGDIIIMKNIKMNTSDSYKLNNDREAKKVYQYLKYSRFQ